ncbi:cobyric acid synthase [Oceanomicrobium pacificus]|uniref:Cobyric acid synthase n=1 Tax=Oceanomicrobium pacificus TaxID=2692916 RepID=A0A6B0TYJ1_9RHOB|nr:cobyric acid synthase [Oceanomicrobium pacificus]MXU66073.1 cobyric acid synthase [Oceanomicrobium pacificus]
MSGAVMIQGTGSNVGKSLLVAGLARAMARRGLSVRPFKPQNMSNNAAVTADGGEIGRAQALQALACGLPPETGMNPVLLKPESDRGAQVILNGARLITVAARDYAALKPRLLPEVLRAFEGQKAQADIVLVEGAGSPAEINLRAGDIANMGFAEAADLPVILAGDIDRGGVIAQLVGTHAVLPAGDRDRIAGFLVNKFRGDPALFSEGRQEIAARTGWADLGLLPWFDGASSLPAEDALDIAGGGSGALKIAVPRLSRIANFDDLDPLKLEPGVTVEMVPPGQALPGDADLILLPGSKSTIADLAFLRAQGWDIDIHAHHRRGGRILGICGGYQMLGRSIADPDGIEGPPGRVDGLGLLEVETVMSPDKRVTQITARTADGLEVTGYEIHLGQSDGPDRDRAWLTVEGRSEGAASRDGQVQGCYLHGLFASDGFRAAYLAALGAAPSTLAYGDAVTSTLDALADHLEKHADIDAILKIAEL